jgi:alkylhydroperoxidase family enzyme
MEEAVVRAVLDDWRTAPVDARLRAMLGYLEQLVLNPEQLSPADIVALRAAGVNDTAIREANYVAFLFGVMDRLADSFDFAIPTAEQARNDGKFLHRNGYVMMKFIR